MVISMNFERLKFIRESVEFSQKELANKLKVSESTYSRWETGEKIIPFKHLITLCNITKLSIDYILEITDEKSYFENFIIINKKEVEEKLREVKKRMI